MHLESTLRFWIGPYHNVFDILHILDKDGVGVGVSYLIIISDPSLFMFVSNVEDKNCGEYIIFCILYIYKI